LLSLLTAYQRVHKYKVDDCIVGGIITQVKRFGAGVVKFFIVFLCSGLDFGNRNAICAVIRKRVRWKQQKNGLMFTLGTNLGSIRIPHGNEARY
ncbi:MAG: hypothetical protein RR804_17355, partial [Massilia sp.]